jgi:hypothetical protein
MRCCCAGKDKTRWTLTAAVATLTHSPPGNSSISSTTRARKSKSQTVIPRCPVLPTRCRPRRAVLPGGARQRSPTALLTAHTPLRSAVARHHLLHTLRSSRFQADSCRLDSVVTAAAAAAVSSPATLGSGRRHWFLQSSAASRATSQPSRATRSSGRGTRLSPEWASRPASSVLPPHRVILPCPCPHLSPAPSILPPDPIVSSFWPSPP